MIKIRFLSRAKFPDMIVQHILKLPREVLFEDVIFVFNVFINGDEELRVCYDISYVRDSSPHKKDYNDYGSWSNPFVRKEERYFCDFLYLVENISNDDELISAIDDTYNFLKENDLLDNE